MRNIFFFLVLLAIYGCTYHSQSKDPITPVTYKDTPYRSADSVGKLRRLALIPVEIESYKGKYASEKDQEAASRSYQDAVTNFLTEKKGYEIIAVRDTDGKWQSDLLGNSGFDNIQDLYLKWHEEKAGKHSAAVIQKIGHTLNVDGVLVIWVKEKKLWGVTEIVLNFALMNIPLFYSIASPDLGAWIYETSTGRLVWSEEHSILGTEPPADTNSLIRLFADLENAVPRQLTK